MKKVYELDEVHKGDVYTLARSPGRWLDNGIEHTNIMVLKGVCVTGYKREMYYLEEPDYVEDKLLKGNFFRGFDIKNEEIILNPRYITEARRYTVASMDYLWDYDSEVYRYYVLLNYENKINKLTIN